MAGKLGCMGSPIERFKSKYKVDLKTGCWNWMDTGCGGNVRHGMIWLNGRYEGAHRFSYRAFVGDIQEGLSVLHRCDNPSCVNPKHLFLGTQGDNVRDMVSKGRQVFYTGEDNPHSVLTVEDVLEIRRLYSTGNHTQKQIGAMYDVHQVHVSAIIRRKYWRDV